MSSTPGWQSTARGGAIPALRTQKQQDCLKFKPSLVYIISSSLPDLCSERLSQLSEHLAHWLTQNMWSLKVSSLSACPYILSSVTNPGLKDRASMSQIFLRQMQKRNEEKMPIYSFCEKNMAIQNCSFICNSPQVQSPLRLFSPLRSIPRAQNEP